MSLREYAKSKAIRFMRDAMRQAFPQVNTAKGSPVRSLLISPAALIYAAIFQEIDVVRQMHLGNYSQLSEVDMDQAALDLLQNRQEGSRSVTNLYVYLEEPTTFTLEQVAYFSNENGVRFAPIARQEITPVDVLTDQEGRYYVTVPVASQTAGEQTQSPANTITGFDNLPPQIIEVTNPQATEGGRPRQNNEQFFRAIRRHFGNPTINQGAGVVRWAETTYDNLESVSVVSPGDPRMVRDEVWRDDDGTPNLDREGEPLATHTDVGTLDFDTKIGRAVASSDVFDPSMAGKRIAIEDDTHVYRTIQEVVAPDEVVISGFDISGSHAATVWNEGPHTANASDVYMYFPSLQVQTTVIDKSILLVADGGQTLSDQKLYYALADGESATSVPGQGRIVVGEGTDEERVFQVTGQGTDGTGPYLEVSEGDASDSFDDQEEIRIYDHTEISLDPDGDISALPVIYVLSVRSLDPVSLDPVEEVSQSEPGVYASPGWYIRNADPVEAFSARETKNLVIDDKWDVDAFRAVEKSGVWNQLETWVEGKVSPTDNGTEDVIRVAGEDFSGFEGRDLTLISDDIALNGDSTFDPDSQGNNYLWRAACTNIDSIRTTVTGMNIRYFTPKGYQDTRWAARFYESNDGGSTVNFLADKFANNGDFVLYGDTLEMTKGSLPTPQGGYDLYVTLGLVQAQGNTYEPPTLHEAYPDMAQSIETVVLKSSTTDLTLTISGDLVAVADKDGLVGGADIDIESDIGEFGSKPLRVTFATHSAIGDLQELFDDGGERAPTENSLSRSVFPSLIDVTLEYKGPSSAAELESDFAGALSEAIKEREGDIKLDLSNALAALDEEGLDDVIDVLPEVRVESYLPDGEREVRYLNPDEATVQEMAVKTTTSPGADRIDLVRVGSEAAPPGRGKLFLGGHDPDRQEILPYEAVIEEDDTLTFVFRTGFTTAFEHRDYEEVRVARRDYDPTIEYTDGKIVIPKTNRPWIRRFRVIERGV